MSIFKPPPFLVITIEGQNFYNTIMTSWFAAAKDRHSVRARVCMKKFAFNLLSIAKPVSCKSEQLYFSLQPSQGNKYSQKNYT